MQDLLTDSITAVFADLSTPAAVRAAETSGHLDRTLWDALVAAGFDLALVPEAAGGSGLCLSDVGGMLQACGRYAAPVPLGEAVWARGLAGVAGVSLPEGVLTLAGGRLDGDRVHAAGVPWGASADWVLALLPATERGAEAVLLPVASAQCTPCAGLAPAHECDMDWAASSVQQRFFLPEGIDSLVVGACLRSAQIAGALAAVLDMTLRYASERQQFGRSLSKFQAIQQQIAVLAEDAFAARMAAALAWDSATLVPAWKQVASAKVVCSEAAVRSCATAHAVHGAMGITAEHDLQLYTRRLMAWRMQCGSEDWWSLRLGQALVGGQCTAWEFASAPD